jgi:hypothetical protein
MRKIIVASMLAVVLSFAFMPISNAEMAKEGEASFINAYSATFKAIPMGKERLQMNYEGTGLVVETSADSPFHNTSFHFLGTLHAIKGVYKDSGFAMYTLPNGDKIYGTFKGSGTLGKGDRKATGTLVGGTGKCTGIEGGWQYAGAGSFRPAKKGTFQGKAKGTVHWKIPEAKK